MAAQIKFFEKNHLDLSFTDATITVTDAVATDNGQSFVDYVRNRNNDSAWLTTDSTDAANTTLEVDFVNTVTLTDIILIQHNFKSYTLKYWDGLAWADFSTAINVSANTQTTTNHEFNSVTTTKLQLIITGCMVTDDDKVLRQFIATNKLLTGQLVGWPVIKNPTHDTNKIITRSLSGKVTVIESLGAFSMELVVNNWNIDADLNIVENIYFGRQGVLVWLCGGDSAQFSHERIGYRKQDIYFMRAIDNYTPEWNKGIYNNGMKIKMKLAEAIS